MFVRACYKSQTNHLHLSLPLIKNFSLLVFPLPSSCSCNCSYVPRHRISFFRTNIQFVCPFIHPRSHLLTILLYFMFMFIYLASILIQLRLNNCCFHKLKIYLRILCNNFSTTYHFIYVEKIVLHSITWWACEKRK